MIPFKLCGIAAGVGFILSLLIGTFIGANIVVALLRALIFGVAFFGLAAGIHFAVTHYVPELLEGGGLAALDIDEGAGQQVDMTIGDDEPAAPLPRMYREAEESDEVGNIDDLSGGMDHIRKSGYTEDNVVPDSASGGVSDSGGGFVDSMGFDDDAAIPSLADFDEDAFAPPVKPAGTEPAEESRSLPEDLPLADSVDGLQDLDALARSFMSSDEDMPEGDAESTLALSPPKRSSGKKGQPLKGDFDPKELAEAIRTTLIKEE